MSVTRREAMLAKLADLDAEHAKAIGGGGPTYVDRHHARGKLLPRERIELLVDPGSAFLELSPLAGWGSDFAVGASLVTGIGVVEGVECLITANDPSVKGGASNPWTVKKGFRAAQIAEENGLPTISLVESGGADLPTQKEIFIPGGKVFRDLTRASARRQPTIALVFGNSTAGGAYVPGMSDYTVMVRGQAKVFLGGPPLVKMATGEESDDESLGGAEMHARVSGLADYLAHDEHDAIRIGRRIVARLNWRKAGSRCPSGGGLGGAGRGRRWAAGPDPGRPQGAVRPARGDRPDLRRRRARQRAAVRRVQAALRPLAGHRLGASPRAADRHPRQRPGRDLQRGGAEGDPVHPARQPGRHPPAVPPQHHRLHGRCRVRAGRDHQARRPDDQRGQQLEGPAPQRHHGRVVRRGELRHERPRLRPPLPLHLAEREVRGDGPRPARGGPVHRGPRRRRGARPGLRRARPTPACGPSSSRASRSRACRSSCPGCCTTTASSTRGTPGPCSAICLSVIENAPIRGADGYGVFRT